MIEASRPPSTGRLAPFIQRAPSEHRNRTAGAISGAEPARPTRAMSSSTRGSPKICRNSFRIGVVDRAGAHSVDAQSAVLEQRLMRGPHRPQQQELLRQRIGFAVRNLMGGEERAEIGESGRGQERLGALEIGAPAVAGDRGDVDDGAALPQPRRDGLSQFSQAIKVDRQRFRRPDHAGDAGDVA